MTQIMASGGNIDVTQYIGMHECSSYPPSLFSEEGSMHSGNKSSLVKAILEETDVKITDQLPDSDLKTAVIVDAMFAIRHCKCTGSPDKCKRIIVVNENDLSGDEEEI